MRKIATATVLVCFGLLVALVLFLRHRGDRSPDTGPTVRPSFRIETRKIEANRWIVSRVEKDAYLNDLARATKQTTLKPNPGKEPESVLDLTVFKLAEESPMYAAGFRKDDRILKVNGTPIGTMSRAVNLVHEIKACSQLTVQVQRGDQIIEYQFDFE